MPVQQRSSTPSRARIAWIGVVLPLLALGCAHRAADSESPELEARESEVANLRRENANLRTSVQQLEERIRLLEAGGRGSTSVGSTGYHSYSVDPDPEAWAEPDLEGPRQLPVVKLTPNERSIGRREVEPERGAPPPAPTGATGSTGGTGARGSIALSPVPHSGAPDYAGDYVVDARGDVEYDAPAHDELAPSPGPANEPASYRLVGSKLVQATKRKPTASAGRSSDRDSGVVKDYKAAMTVYRDGRYAEAEQAFASIVAAHPNHDYADNALYWQGEAAYDQAHYADALAAFTKVVERYGGGNKAPDALLKIGLCYGRLGDAANARDVLSQLVAAYPRAEASKIAKRKLADLDD